MEEEDEPDESVLDWWSKYFASIETLKEVCPFEYSQFCLLLHVSYGTFFHKHNPIRLTNTSRLVFQILRAQEAAQAEAEEREDIEIAAETAGIELYQITMLPASMQLWLKSKSLNARKRCFDAFLFYLPWNRAMLNETEEDVVM